MSKNAKTVTILIIVAALVVLGWEGGQWLWHKLLVMHGMAK